MFVVVVGNQKGGCAKTTTVANLAAIAGGSGLRVLAVDADPQGQLTESFVAEAHPGASLGELLDRSSPARPTFDAVRLREVAPGVDLLPADMRPLERAEKDMDGDPLSGLTVMRDVLDAVRDAYDLVLIDTRPSLNSLTVGALVAADGVVVPMMPKSFHFMSSKAFIEKVNQVKASPLNPGLELIGVLFSNVDPAAEETAVIETMVADEGWPLLEAHIPESKLASKVIMLGQLPAAIVYPYLPFARAFRSAANEIMDRLADLPDAAEAEAASR